MVIGLLTARISIPGARSLKDKRAVIRSIRDRTTARMNVSVAETDRHDCWRSAELAFVTVAGEKLVAERRLARIGRDLSCGPGHVLLDLHTEWL